MKQWFLILMYIAMLFTGCSYDSTPQPIPSEPSISSNQESISESNQKESEIEIPENPDFRNTKWGMSLNQVKEIESISNSELVSEDQDSLLYTDKVLDYNTDVMFNFNENGLYNGFYMFQIERANQNMFYNDYTTIVEAYTKKYGEPNESYERWLVSLYQDKPEDLGLAIASGHVLFGSIWETDTTKISIILMGDDFKIKLVSSYQSIKELELQNENMDNNI